MDSRSYIESEFNFREVGSLIKRGKFEVGTVEVETRPTFLSDSVKGNGVVVHRPHCNEVTLILDNGMKVTIAKVW